MNQTNRGEFSGDMWASWNLDLTSNIGKIRVSPHTESLASTAGLATLVKPVAFVRNLSGSGAVDTYFSVCNQRIISTPVASISWVADDITNSPTTALDSLYSDAVSFNGSLIVSLKTDVAKLTSGTWTAAWWTGTIGGATLTTGIAHPLCVSFNNLLLIGNGSNVASVDITGTFDDTAIILPNEYEVIWMRSSNSAVWIGARHKFGGRAKVFMWDGYSENYNGDYEVGSSITFAGVIKDGVCHTVNGNGKLMAFNGGGFTEVARFPIADDKVNTFDDNLTTYPININKNGIEVIDNNIHILINATVESTGGTSFLLSNMLSGVWEYTPETGLHHKYSIGKNESNVLEFGSPLLVMAGALFPTGDKRKFLAGVQMYVADGSSTSTELGNIVGINQDAKKKFGYIITPQIHTQNVEEIWNKIYLLYSKLKQTGDFISVKYRQSVNNIPTPNQISSTGSLYGTWTSTTTFTTTLSYFSGVSIGDEIEIMSGEGAGLSATITDISFATPTYTVTIDYTLTGASGTFNFKTSNWVLIDSITDLITTNKEFSVEKNSNWIQFKICLYGLGSLTYSLADSPELEKLIIKSSPQLKAN